MSARKISYDPTWPRWTVTQGTSRFTCYAKTQAEAERQAGQYGFKRPKAAPVEATP